MHKAFKYHVQYRQQHTWIPDYGLHMPIAVGMLCDKLCCWYFINRLTEHWIMCKL